MIGATDPAGVETRGQQEMQMSERNGDRARFQKERKRKMLRRQRTQALIAAIRPPAPTPAEPADAGQK